MERHAFIKGKYEAGKTNKTFQDHKDIFYPANCKETQGFEHVNGDFLHERDVFCLPETGKIIFISDYIYIKECKTNH